MQKPEQSPYAQLLAAVNTFKPKHDAEEASTIHDEPVENVVSNHADIISHTTMCVAKCIANMINRAPAMEAADASADAIAKKYFRENAAPKLNAETESKIANQIKNYKKGPDANEYSIFVNEIALFIHYTKVWSGNSNGTPSPYTGDDAYLVLMLMYIQKSIIDNNKYLLGAPLNIYTWRYFIAAFYIIAKKAWSKRTTLQTRQFANMYTNCTVDCLRLLEAEGLKTLDNNIKIVPAEYGKKVHDIKVSYELNNRDSKFTFTDSIIANEFKQL
jgi:hypothetical protein